MKNFRSALSLLLTISYISGSKIVEFSIYYQRYFNLLYMLLFWTVYCFLLRYTVMSYINVYATTVYLICLYADISTALLSVAVGVYHNKKFKDFLKKLTIVDDTLEKLGTTIDYHKLYVKTIWLVLGWIIIVMLLTYTEVLWLQNEYNYDVTTAIYIVCMLNYCSHLKSISNMIFMSILRHIKLKFDQINEFLWNLTRDKSGITFWKDSILHSHEHRFPDIANRDWLIYVSMHLHLELNKISREIDSILGIETTMSIGCYFFWLAHCFYEILNLIFINDFIKSRILYTVLNLFWCLYFIFKLIFINYVCERISTKASATGDLINKISYSNCDIYHKDIPQFLLQIVQAPLKFCGLGLFQFGYKVFHDFFKYTGTILVILVQMHMNN